MTETDPADLTAIELATARIAERPGDDAAHELRARAHLALGHLDDAEHDAAAAVRLDPDEVRYRELLAEVLAVRGAHRDAAAEFARLARRDPRQVAWTVAEAWERLGASDPDGGVRVARQAIRLDPTNADAQLTLARGLIRLGDPTAALTAAARAAELRPADPEVREVLADALWLAGHAPQAFTAFRSLLQDLGDADRRRVLAKARELHRMHAGWAGRLVASVIPLFAFAFRRGWLSVR